MYERNSSVVAGLSFKTLVPWPAPSNCLSHHFCHATNLGLLEAQCTCSVGPRKFNKNPLLLDKQRRTDAILCYSCHPCMTPT